jgi:hypothetical protein
VTEDEAWGRGSLELKGGTASGADPLRCSERKGWGDDSLATPLDLGEVEGRLSRGNAGDEPNEDSEDSVDAIKGSPKDVVRGICGGREDGEKGLSLTALLETAFLSLLWRVRAAGCVSKEGDDDRAIIGDGDGGDRAGGADSSELADGEWSATLLFWGNERGEGACGERVADNLGVAVSLEDNDWAAVGVDWEDEEEGETDCR